MTDKEFIETYNECYPFERYIVKNPKKINYLFDDTLLCELFIPSTEIKPIIYNGEFVGSTQVNKDEIYVKLKCKNDDENWTEFRMAYYDFNDHIREEIRRIIISDFGDYEWECLYVEHENENNDLTTALQIQKKLIEEKYGTCNVKDNFIGSKQKLLSIDHVNYAYDKWTIKDANDGDVIQLGKVTAIFKKYIGREKCICYCSFCKDGGFEIPIENGDDNVYGCYNATPATKEQRDTMIKAMYDAGYEWDILKRKN